MADTKPVSKPVVETKTTEIENKSTGFVEGTLLESNTNNNEIISVLEKLNETISKSKDKDESNNENTTMLTKVLAGLLEKVEAANKKAENRPAEPDKEIFVAGPNHFVINKFGKRIAHKDGEPYEVDRNGYPLKKNTVEEDDDDTE